MIKVVNHYLRSQRPDSRVDSVLKHVPEFDRIANLEQDNKKYINLLRKKEEHLQILSLKTVDKTIKLKQLNNHILDLLETIGLCRDQFRFYKREHLAKQSFVKADTNKDFEKTCQKTIDDSKGEFGE